ncbi:hypothetical protein PIB30_089469 [Stylosanthes scabra]|uniref:RRM domain-containing protein n=1 Tax=Stylosanthes scabra TaxID=79078 RepID=A0ABU6QVD9_9FABA|nr:hypothetical protein [Stylosanthes scabra]
MRVWREKHKEGEGSGSDEWNLVRNRNRNSHHHWNKHQPTPHRAHSLSASAFGQHRGIRGDFQGNGTVVTLFADNLPPNTTVDWLWRIFRLEGHVVDAFLSRKKRVGNPSLFGFVRFTNKAEAERAIQKRNGWVVWGHKIKLSIVRYEKNHSAATDRTMRMPPNHNKKEDVQGIDSDRNDARVKEGRSFREAVINGKKDHRVLDLRDSGKVDDFGNSVLILTPDGAMREKMD